MMTFGDLFSGIGGFRLGLERAGMECAWACEIDPFCRKVYLKHWPDTEPFYEDIRNVTNPPYVDLLCGGFPCQGLSIAGQRRGLADHRSGLFWEIIRLVGEVQPQWILLENVPGFLSSAGRRDFGLALAALDECGYGVAWRVLDAQYFGVPQRRRRVYIVGYLGGPCPSSILFESQGSRRRVAAGKEAGQETSRTLRGRANCSHREDSDTFKWAKGSSGPSGDEHHNFVVHSLTGEGADASEDGTGRGTPIIIQASNQPRADVRCGYGIQEGGPMFTLDTSQQHAVGAETDTTGMRETTGFSRQLDPPDGPRYRAIGNAVAVPVIEWIGRRIMERCRK